MWLLIKVYSLTPLHLPSFDKIRSRGVSISWASASIASTGAGVAGARKNVSHTSNNNNAICWVKGRLKMESYTLYWLMLLTQVFVGGGAGLINANCL